MATILATIDVPTKSLTLQYQNSCKDNTKNKATAASKITIPLQPPTLVKTYRAGIWGDQVLVDDMGEEVASFLQTIINTDSEIQSQESTRYQKIRLVSFNPQNRRYTDNQYTPSLAKTWYGTNPTVSLTDGYPILIACQTSLDELNRRLLQQGKEPIPMSRFRPNLVITGTRQAFEEDSWKTIAITTTTINDSSNSSNSSKSSAVVVLYLSLVKGCPRCKQSCSDQVTGITNFDYLLHLNMLAGRSYIDICQYPVMPWVLSNYRCEEIPDLCDQSRYPRSDQAYGCAKPR